MKLSAIYGKVLNESTIVDKFGDELKIDENWPNLKFPVAEYKTKVKDSLVNIITQERGISEKSFNDYDNVITEVKQCFTTNSDYGKLIDEGKSKSLRPQFVAEMIYYKHKF